MLTEKSSLNQNGKGLEETLPGFNSYAVKTILKRLQYLKMSPSLLQFLQKSLPIPLSLYYTQ